jgi:hypothetical protein
LGRSVSAALLGYPCCQIMPVSEIAVVRAF